MVYKYFYDLKYILKSNIFYSKDLYNLISINYNGNKIN